MRERLACRHMDREFQWQRFKLVASISEAISATDRLNMEALRAAGEPLKNCGLHVFEYRVKPVQT